MYRRIVLYNSSWTNGPIDVLYHVRGARLLSQQRINASKYDANFSVAHAFSSVVFADSILLKASTGIGTYRTFEFVVDVPENQPAQESIEETTSTGSAVVVFNENGVVVCSNGGSIPANSAPEQTVGPGEMTSVPGEEPGEMASETTDDPGAMI